MNEHPSTFTPLHTRTDPEKYSRDQLSLVKFFARAEVQSPTFPSSSAFKVAVL